MADKKNGKKINADKWRSTGGAVIPVKLNEIEFEAKYTDVPSKKKRKK